MPQIVYHQAGPLPIMLGVDWPSDLPVLVAVSGSAYAHTPNTTLAVKVSIHDTTIGMLQHFANPAGTHLTFPDGFFVVDGEFGQTSIFLNASTSTITDKNDVFTVVLSY